jgi:hypothetical protein
MKKQCVVKKGNRVKFAANDNTEYTAYYMHPDCSSDEIQRTRPFMVKLSCPEPPFYRIITNVLASQGKPA